MKIEVKLTPAEFRKMLGDTQLGKMYDKLVADMVKQGVDKREAEAMIAPMFLESVKRFKEA